MNSEKRIVEINGVKMEVDLSTCRRIDEFRVGDAVKILHKGNDYRSDTIFVGTIVEFVNFKELPTIKIAVFKQDYHGSAEIEFIYYNKNTKEYEIIPAMKSDLTLEKAPLLTNSTTKLKKRKTKLPNSRRSVTGSLHITASILQLMKKLKRRTNNECCCYYGALDL